MMTIEIDPNRQYIFGVDISGSMDTVDSKTKGLTRYNYSLERIGTFIKRSEDFDPDGPTLITFGEKIQVFENTKYDAISEKLQSPVFEGYTNTHLAIQKAYDLHKAQKKADGDKHPGTILMLMTDGAPTERKAVRETIIRIANEVERDDEFSITFLTTGEINNDLKAYLTELDELKAPTVKFDIVDVKPLEEVEFLAAVAGALVD